MSDVAEKTSNVIAALVREWDHGRVKWFDPVRRWGWVIPDQGEDDIFLPWQVLQDCGIKEPDVRTNVRVTYQWQPPDGPGRRPKVVRIKILRNV